VIRAVATVPVYVVSLRGSPSVVPGNAGRDRGESDMDPGNAEDGRQDPRPKHLILADLLSGVIRKFASKKGISIKEARRIFISALEKYPKGGDALIESGPIPEDYDPADDPDHPMHGWRPGKTD
jgi:hypothetical protein